MQPIPSFRSFVSVELPFCLEPHCSDERSAEQLREVEAFIPASFLHPFLQDAPCSLGTGKPLYVPERVGSSTVNEPSCSADAATDSLHVPPKSMVTPLSTDAPSNRLSLTIRDPQEYRTEHVFSGWRGTNWGLDKENDDIDDPLSFSTPANDVADRVKAQRRRAVFPSTFPQLHLRGYYRNDLLVRVTRSKRVRRFRNAETGAIVREEELADDQTDADDAPVVQLPRVDVIGVVSREVELSRPADFAFELFSDKQCHDAPHFCSPDIFPPMFYLNDKATYEVRYEMGRASNTTVRREQRDLGGDNMASNGAFGLETGAEGTQWNTVAMPTVTVEASHPDLPPAPLEVHRQFIRHIGSSFDGPCETDPPEVRTVRRLLQERPAWMTKDLMEAVLQSGACPRANFTKQVIICLTYVIATGPFNRLRIRLDYNPYCLSLSSVYQRFTVRLARRSELGTQLRDVSRSHHIHRVVEQILAAHKETKDAYHRLHGQSRSTLIEVLCRVVLGGYLNIAFQLIDIINDPSFMGIVDGVAAAENMPSAHRGNRCGWLTEGAFVRVSHMFTEVLSQFLKEEVIPQFRSLQSSALADNVYGDRRKKGDDAGLEDTNSGGEEPQTSDYDNESHVSNGSLRSLSSSSGAHDTDGKEDDYDSE